MWGGCSQVFDDFGALVGHVNLEHLRPTDVAAVRRTTTANPIPTPSHTPVASPLMNGTLQAVAQGWHSWESAGRATDQVGQAVTAMDWPSMPSLSTDSSSYVTPAAPSVSGRSSSVFSSSSPLLSAASSTGDPPRMLSIPPRGPSADAEDGVHTCRWQGCSTSMSTSAALNAHIDEVHIGSGQGHYDCHWADCNRHGDNGFSSKQKVRRHIQVSAACRSQELWLRRVLAADAHWPPPVPVHGMWADVLRGSHSGTAHATAQSGQCVGVSYSASSLY
jgi:hypothetical protein